MAGSDDAGLTLIETMIALAIIGVMSGVAVLGLAGVGSRIGPEAEARRLAARLRFAADETMVTDRSLAFSWDPRGYGFVTWDGAGHRWTPAADRALGERHDMPSGLRLEGAAPTRPIPIAVDGAGAPIELAVADHARAWRVSFDGLSASVASGAAP